jgi:hypothetical protein
MVPCTCPQGIPAWEDQAGRLSTHLLYMRCAGPGGASVREISKSSGADIRSWNDTFVRQGSTHQVRCVVVEGKRRAVVLVSHCGCPDCCMHGGRPGALSAWPA